MTWFGHLQVYQSSHSIIVVAYKRIRQSDRTLGHELNNSWLAHQM